MTAEIVDANAVSKVRYRRAHQLKHAVHRRGVTCKSLQLRTRCSPNLR